MQLINNPFNEEAYTYKTKAGLNVIIVNKKGFERSLVAYGTNFGALDLIQSVEDKHVSHKQGLAHFLEHKLFEDEDGDILSQFARLGANANAFTSYESTVYYFSTNMGIKAPLELLLKFVNRLNIDEASVEKEKGIIIEELKMYENNPDFNLFYRAYRNVYNTFPLRYDIAGTQESINATTVADLQQAYELNYQPSKMCLVVISGENPEVIKMWIDNQEISDRYIDVETIYEEESLTVAVEEDIYEFPVVLPKYCIAYKFAYPNNAMKLDAFMTQIILEMNFSEFDDNYQMYLDEDIYSENFSYNVDLREGFGVIYFFNEGDKSAEFLKIIDEKMHNLQLNETDFKQLKRRHYGQVILSLSQYDGYAINMMDSYFKKQNYYDFLEQVRALEFADIVEFRAILKNFTKSFTKLAKNKVY